MLHHLTLLLYSLITLVPVLIHAASNDASRAWLEANSKKDGVVTLPSGLQYKVLRSGSGKFHPTLSSNCVTHYRGTLIDGTQFDSSYDRGSPATFRPNQVVKGWTEILQLMVEGDKYEVYIPSDLGYGDYGSPPKIGGGDALIFEMELIQITGDTVPARKCDTQTFEGCDDNEKAYIQKIMVKFGNDLDKLTSELERLEKLVATASMTDELRKALGNKRILLGKMQKQLMIRNEQSVNEL